MHRRSIAYRSPMHRRRPSPRARTIGSVQQLASDPEHRLDGRSASRQEELDHVHDLGRIAGQRTRRAPRRRLSVGRRPSLAIRQARELDVLGHGVSVAGPGPRCLRRRGHRRLRVARGYLPAPASDRDRGREPDPGLHPAPGHELGHRGGGRHRERAHVRGCVRLSSCTSSIRGVHEDSPMGPRANDGTCRSVALQRRGSGRPRADA